MSLEDKIQTIQSEIVRRVKTIQSLQEEKKTVASTYSERIKSIEGEKKKLLQDLEETQRAMLEEDADEILVKNGDVALTT